MKNLGTKGFTLVEGLLILVILGMIGGTGYYVWVQNKKDDSANNSKQEASIEQANAHQSSDSKDAETEEPVVTDEEKKDGKLTIDEWGIYVHLGPVPGGKDATNKMTYIIEEWPNKSSGDQVAWFSLSKEITTSCNELGFGLLRSTNQINGKYKKAGDAYYASVGTPEKECTPNGKAGEIWNQINSSSIVDLQFNAV